MYSNTMWTEPAISDRARSLHNRFTFRNHHLVQANDVLVFQALEQLDFPHGCDWKPVLLAFHPYPLESDIDAGLGIPRLVYFTISPLSNAIQTFVCLGWVLRTLTTEPHRRALRRFTGLCRGGVTIWRSRQRLGRRRGWRRRRSAIIGRWSSRMLTVPHSAVTRRQRNLVRRDSAIALDRGTRSGFRRSRSPSTWRRPVSMTTFHRGGVERSQSREILFVLRYLRF